MLYLQHEVSEGPRIDILSHIKHERKKIYTAAPSIDGVGWSRINGENN